MSLLTIVQTVAARLGVPTPLVAVASGDQQVRQLVALLGQVGEFISQEYTEFEAFTRRAVFTSVAGEDQGALTTLLGAEAKNGFNYIVPETFWDLTRRRPIFGGISDKESQAQRAYSPLGPISRYQIAGGRLMLLPPPGAGRQLSLVWKSKNWITTYPNTVGNPSVPGSVFVSDDDMPMLDEYLLKQGLEAYWRRNKGLPYAETMADFLSLCETKCGRSKAKSALYLDENGRGLQPGIFVPQGNWPVA